MKRQDGKDNTVLLIENNPKDVAMILLAFETNAIGNRVVVFNESREALAFLAAVPPQGALPRLVLLDLMGPGREGEDVLKAIRADKRTAILPVVILTTSERAEDVSRCYQLGANAYVQKPDSYEGYITTIFNIGQFWLNTNAQVPSPTA